MVTVNNVRTSLTVEFERQVRNLLSKGYPALAGLSENEFVQRLEALKGRLESIEESSRSQSHTIPFLIVVKGALVPAAGAMAMVESKGGRGRVDMRPVDPESFEPIEGLQIPDSMVYLAVDVETGQDSLNVTPAEALEAIIKRNRSPLTIDEGVALVTHFPEVLTDKQRYNCFSMAGSRRDDQKVPALWISYGKPRLGWCWDNNPHTWLGTASCGGRTGL